MPVPVQWPEAPSATNFDCYLPKGWQFQKVLSRGCAHGVVIQLADAGGTSHAAKVLPLGVNWVEDESALREISAHSYVRRAPHPNLLTMADCWVAPREGKGQKLYIAAQLMQQGLDAWSRGVPGLRTPAERAPVIRGIFAGLAHLHKNGIVHRDLKACNIMVRQMPDSTMETRLIDFGSWRASVRARRNPVTRHCKMTGSKRVATPGFIAPEGRNDSTEYGKKYGSSEYGQPFDCWACGAIVCSIFKRGDDLFSGGGRLPREEVERNALPAMRTRASRERWLSGQLGSAAWGNAVQWEKELMLGLLEPVPEKRLSARDVVDRLGLEPWENGLHADQYDEPDYKVEGRDMRNKVVRAVRFFELTRAAQASE